MVALHSRPCAQSVHPVTCRISALCAAVGRSCITSSPACPARTMPPSVHRSSSRNKRSCSRLRCCSSSCSSRRSRRRKRRWRHCTHACIHARTKHVHTHATASTHARLAHACSTYVRTQHACAQHAYTRHVCAQHVCTHHACTQMRAPTHALSAHARTHARAYAHTHACACPPLLVSAVQAASPSPPCTLPPPTPPVSSTVGRHGAA